ncbi:D-alanine--D-alanine ligase family protein [Rhizobium mongolense]|uniref:D-alanine-D-alanine ligase n=1 Tax=Rhizobium mongolense TaxID=57676 RepID=A0A7W6RS45_9HYPH|nr:ATP-grasp domain-containing protein [Rhizobium mongolense]MBB4277630.1 D-alanine-D-alanine ligase [Rhizobium mongolense]
MRVAVVWNNNNTGVINRFGQSYPMSDYRETIENVVAALQEGGHETLLCEGDIGLLSTLGRFMPPDSQNRPSGMVFNLAEGIQGECRYAHVPAMLEMAGVPYTGPNPLGHGLASDKVITKRLIRDCGVPTPNFRVMRLGTEDTGDLRFPVVVKPRDAECSHGLQLVHEPTQLRQAVEAIVTQYAQDALVEEYIEGREICVALLGNEELEVLPLVEQDFGDRKTRMMTWEAKYMPAAAPKKICPAQVGSRLATVLRDISVSTFQASQGRDYARVDLRIDRSGQPFVLEINNIPSLSMGASYFRAAKTAGHSFSSLVNRILDIAHARYFGNGIP